MTDTTPPQTVTVRFEPRGPGRYDFYDAGGNRVGSAESVGGRVQWAGLDGAGGYADSAEQAAGALAAHLADRYRDHTAHDVVLNGSPGDHQWITVTCRTCSPHVELLDVEGPVAFAEVLAVIRGQQPTEQPEQVATCRVCGCTDTDCSGCIEATGEPCYWIAPDLCSRCGHVAAQAALGALSRQQILDASGFTQEQLEHPMFASHDEARRQARELDAGYAAQVMEQARQMYACPTCGRDGPPIALAIEPDGILVECRDTACAAEFRIPVKTP